MNPSLQRQGHKDPNRNEAGAAHLSRDLCVVIMVASPLVSYWGRPARPNTYK